MLIYPSINPIAFHIGTWPVYWYGLMYLFGLLIAWALMLWRAQTSGLFTQEEVADILFFSAIGIIVGGRLGYVLFYDWQMLWQDPLQLFQTWKGGMSFHGGLIGVLLAFGWLAFRMKRSYWYISDFVAPVVPLGLGLGRLGNFINGELWGRMTLVPWGMVFPNAGSFPRHPSQLYEAFFEGLVLFLILWFYSRKLRPLGAVSGLFLLLYGLFRCGLEFFREPDLQIGFLWGNLTEGQLLSLPMMLFGVMILVSAYRKKEKS